MRLRQVRYTYGGWEPSGPVRKGTFRLSQGVGSSPAAQGLFLPLPGCALGPSRVQASQVTSLLPCPPVLRPTWLRTALPVSTAPFPSLGSLVRSSESAESSLLSSRLPTGQQRLLRGQTCWDHGAGQAQSREPDTSISPTPQMGPHPCASCSSILGCAPLLIPWLEQWGRVFS